MPTLEKLVQRLSVTGEVSAADARLILSIPMRLKDVERGDEITVDGSIVDRSCIVLDGLVGRTKGLRSGGRQIMSLHIAGDIPDLHSLHLRTLDHSLVSIGSGTVGFLMHDDIREALAQSPTLTNLLWRDTLIDAAIFREWILLLGQADATTRMGHLICELYVRSQIAGLSDVERFELPLTQSDLSDCLGISVVHANRVLQELRGKGLIKWHGGVISILDWPSLRHLAHFDDDYLHHRAAPYFS